MNQRRKKKKIIALVIVITLLIAALAFFVYRSYTLQTSNKQLEETIAANTQTVYVAIADIQAGEKLSEENVAPQTISSGLESWNYITQDQLGCTAAIDIIEGTPILNIMVSDVEYDKDTRDYEISVANLMISQANYDTVDVRIMFPNGEDYIILTKKTITNLNLEGAVFTTTLNEEEILRMASATIDAYTTTGAYIYTTNYIANAQEEATPTYLVRAETLDLINSDPNVLTTAQETLNLSARLSLESRLAGMTEEELEAVVNGHSIADTAGSSTAASTANGDTYEDAEGSSEDDINDITEKSEETLDDDTNAESEEED